MKFLHAEHKGFIIVDIDDFKHALDTEMTDSQIAPGMYEHYKGKKYFVLGLTKNTETGEVCVVYRPLYETDWPHLVHRNATMFFEDVTVNGKQVPRFRKIA